jgi:septal ring factor EnvC (AmiA/AmiB activator)
VEPATKAASNEAQQEWRRKEQQLEEEILSLRRELDDAHTQNEKLERALRTLRKQLSPLHHALRAVFGEIELAVGEEQISSVGATRNSAEPTNSGNAGRWDAIKGRLTKKQSELIDVLLLQGRMNRTQCAKAIKSDYTFCRKSVVAPLLAQGLLIEGGDGLLDLKPL